MTTVAHRDRLDDELAWFRRQHTEVLQEFNKARNEATRNPTDENLNRAEAVGARLGDIKKNIGQLEALVGDRLASYANGHTYQGDDAYPDAATVEVLQREAFSSRPVGTLNLPSPYSRDELVKRLNAGTFGVSRMAAAGPVTVPVDSPARMGSGPGIVPALRAPLTLLGLIPASPTDGATVPYLIEEPGGFHATEVAEMALKPEGEVTLTDAEAPVQTIAVWAKTPRGALADVLGLRQTIDGKLSYDVGRRLQGQIVAGDGLGNNIQGILNTTGVAQVPYAAGPLSDLILDGITAVTTSDAVPDAVVLNPVDLAAMLKATTATGGERLDSGGSFSSTPSTIWGLPAVPSNALPVGTAIVGAFSTCCRLWVRETIVVRITDSDQDDWVKNRCTLLAEGRFAFTVTAPAGFAEVDLSATTE